MGAPQSTSFLGLQLDYSLPMQNILVDLVHSHFHLDLLYKLLHVHKVLSTSSWLRRWFRLCRFCRFYLRIIISNWFSWFISFSCFCFSAISACAFAKASCSAFALLLLHALLPQFLLLLVHEQLFLVLPSYLIQF